MAVSSKARILVVDDEESIASTLAALFAHHGYDTALAYSGEEAVKTARSFAPDFILSDVLMDGMSGIDAAMEILRFLPRCEVLFISGNGANLNLLQDAKARGFDFEVLPKPIRMSELLGRISEALAQSSRQDGKLSA